MDSENVLLYLVRSEKCDLGTLGCHQVEGFSNGFSFFSFQSLHKGKPGEDDYSQHYVGVTFVIFIERLHVDVLHVGVLCLGKRLFNGSCLV